VDSGEDKEPTPYSTVFLKLLLRGRCDSYAGTRAKELAGVGYEGAVETTDGLNFSPRSDAVIISPPGLAICYGACARDLCYCASSQDDRQ
jgi:hypothetical protein